MKITKIALSVITSFAILSLMMGCSEEVYDGINNGSYKPSLESNYLLVSPRDFSFFSSEETMMGSITSENSWSFSSVPSWLSISPSSGSSDATFTIASKANESVSNREAVFYVSTNSIASKIQRTLTASQMGSSPYITFPEYDSSTITIEGKGVYLIIDVDSNTPDLTVSFSQSWALAEYNADAKTINIGIQANETNSSRNGILTVSSSLYNTTTKLTINQLASEVTVLEGTGMDFDADGGSQTRTISSDLPWTAQTTYSWIEFSPKSGNTGETTMTITTLPSYDSDKRIGQIYFYFEDTQKKYIGITQTGRYINVSPTSISLSSAEGSSDKINIESNIDWKITSYPDWIEVSPISGSSGLATVNVAALKNNSMNSRSGKITLCDTKSVNITTTIEVSQNGLDFEGESLLEFNWRASSLPYKISIPSSWTAAVSNGWITMSQYSGNGDEEITIYVTRNDTEDTRTGKITIYTEGTSFDIVVVQEGQYLTLDSTSGEISASGGSIELSVYSSMNTEYSVEYDGDVTNWVSISDSGNGVYKINVSENNSSMERTCVLNIKPVEDDFNEIYTQGVKYIIRQNGRSIATGVSHILMYASGGTSSEYVISADGEYSLSKGSDDYWFSIISGESTNSFRIMCAENTSGSSREGSVIISLKDLPSGETMEKIINVIQYDYTFSIQIEDYEEDEIIY